MTEHQANSNRNAWSFCLSFPLRQREIVMTNSNSNQSLFNDKMVDMVFITEFTGLSDKWFYKLISDGQFPKPIKLGRSSRWLESEVENWIKQRIQNSRN